ncbi:MAG: metalloprotease [Sandaracinaceae bacterium]
MGNAHLRILGVPVRFDPTFLLLAGGFGFMFFLTGDDPEGTAMFLVWLPLITFAVLAHELGHALTARAFGLTPFVVLHGMGGFTTFVRSDHRALSHGRRVLITLAGPFAGFVVGVAAFAIERFGGLTVDSVPQRALTLLFWVTAGWGLVNLLPVLPLDGGHVVATVLDRLFGRRGVQAARLGSMTAALGAAGLSAVGEYWLGAVLCVLLAVLNYRAYRHDAERNKTPLEPLLDAGDAALGAGQWEAAARVAAALEDRDKTEAQQRRHAHLGAWAWLMMDHPVRAAAALAVLPSAPDALLDGRVRLANGDAQNAVGPLLEALIDRGDDEIARCLGDAIEAAGDVTHVDGPAFAALEPWLVDGVIARVAAPGLRHALRELAPATEAEAEPSTVPPSDDVDAPPAAPQE